MLRALWRKLDETERKWRASFGNDISTPEERRRSLRHLDWMDHGILRRRWHNFAQVAPGVFRSNQPGPDRFASYADMGIRTVLNLRGAVRQSYYLFEEEICAQRGMTLIDVALSARAAPRREALLELLKAFDTAERPLLMHCKSGADRTGLAAALYLLACEGATLATARGQLSRRFLHFRKSKTGMMDHFLDLYERETAVDPMPIRDWIAGQYDPDRLTRSFETYRANDYR